MTLALLFPGQGSQSVGMGAALADAFASARAVFAEVDEALGQNLSQLMREGPEDQLTLTENAQPALMAVSVAAMRVLKTEFGFDLAKARRWAHFNMWRPITPPPQDYPLAVCDARSIRPGDGITVVAETVTRTAGAFSFDTTGYLHNPDHRWCYFSQMTPEEVLVFITHDSDPARPHQVAHTAFLDPKCPPGTPTRGSGEMRAFAVFD